MKHTCFFITFLLVCTCLGAIAQENPVNEITKSKIYNLIGLYVEAREKQDTLLLRSILTSDIDQLVSSGQWRVGIKTAMEGMQRSSATNEGKRILTVEKWRLISPTLGIVDAKYQIIANEGSVRNMWSTFIIVKVEEQWKIAAIRNMLPTTQ